MIDREKVLKGLECCQYSSKSHCDECPYCYEGLCETNDCTADLASDVLALLKEQEAVKPIKSPDKDDDYTFMCSNCKGELFCGDVLRDNFCPTCGRKVKWE